MATDCCYGVLSVAFGNGKYCGPAGPAPLRSNVVSRKEPDHFYSFCIEMALQPDVNNPVCGYFVTSEFPEVYAYTVALIRKYNKSIVFLLHASQVFEKDGVEEELHLPINLPTILDPQMPDDFIDEILSNQYLLCQEPEHYENMQGSGWTEIPGTIRYWFKIYICQPNAGASPNQNNVSDNDDPTHHDDPEIANASAFSKYQNFFLYSVVEHYARLDNKKMPRVWGLKSEFLRNYNAEKPLGFPDGDFYVPTLLQDVPEYHKGLGFLNVRIFSMRGNVLYATKLSPEIDSFIDLYVNSAGIISLVLDLWKLFKKKENRFFCMKCLKWGTKDSHNCEKVLVSSKSDEVLIPDIPWGRHGLTAYADFESYIYDKTYHNLSGWGCVIIDKDGDIYDSHYTNIISEPLLIKRFVDYLTSACITYVGEGVITDDCQICGMLIGPAEQKEVFIGRNFINGKAGSHHFDCWMHAKNTMYVFFHNFRGYDSHFLVKELAANVNIVHMSASSMEKFNLIQIEGAQNTHEDEMRHYAVRICFKDTFNFFTCSLAKMVSMVEDWVYCPEEARKDKGIFPYDWFDCKEKLWSTSLPRGPWHNVLTNTEVDATEAFKVWEEKKFTYFHEYHDYYMMLDVMQLCDCFEEFRRTCVQEFQTDPVHFQGAPGLTWYLGLCQNPKLFKIILDKGVYMDIQNNIRGGISQAMTRYCNVEDKPNQSMFFLDVNSLYSKCMTYKMPTKYICSSMELPENWRELYNANTDETALLCVDLVYPEHLHDRDWAYPLAPHKYNDRLCTTFKRKDMYLIHAELLAFYLDRGLILEDFHYMYIFKQDYTLRDYVQGNIEKRRHTNSEVMKTLYKLLNNSLYGKTCENVHKYRKFGVITDESIMASQFHDVYPFNQVNSELSECFNIIGCGENFLVEKPVKTVKLNKPIQIGFTILEFAKREIYNFIAVLQDTMGDRIVPLYTDTDSILLWCDFARPYRTLYLQPEIRPYLDFEKVPWEEEYRTRDTDKQSGLWSVEAGGKEIVEYVGLRAKSYCYRFSDNEVVIKNKGINKSSMIADADENPKEKIRIEHYRKAVFSGLQYYVTRYAIRSYHHEVQTIVDYKLGVSANDTKRAVTSNRAISLPFGYKGEKFKSLTTDLDDPDFLDP